MIATFVRVAGLQNGVEKDLYDCVFVNYVFPVILSREYTVASQ